MIPLGLCSVMSWIVIIERSIRFRKLGKEQRAFHLEVMNSLLRSDQNGLKTLCEQNRNLPGAELLQVALVQNRPHWRQAVERRRQLLNHELKQGLWILGTIGAASPFIGLAGTVVGILRSFGEIARVGSGGFAVVAAGISEALVATAAGIVVAVIAVMAYNALLTRASSLILTLRLQAEEWLEIFPEGR